MAGQLTILKSQLEELAISFGELLMPAIRAIVGWIQQFVDWLNGMDEGTKKAVVTVALLAAALGPVLIVVGKVISAVGTIRSIVSKIAGVINMVKTAFVALNVTMLANPIVLIIAALVVAFIYLWTHCEGFREFWIGLWENVKAAAVAVWNGLKDFFAAAWNGIVSVAQTVWNSLAAFFTGMWDGMKNVVTTVVTAISDFLTAAWNSICSVISMVLTAIHTVVSTVWNGILSAVTTIVNGILSVISTVWNAIYKPRSGSYKRKVFPFSGKVFCENCGKSFTRKIICPGTTRENIIWICRTTHQKGKALCAAKHFTETVMELVSAEVLGLSEFDSAVFEKKIEKIWVRMDDALVFVFRDGCEITREWADIPRCTKKRQRGNELCWQ